MGNRKIDQLPNYTGDTSGVHVVINNSSNTTTYTVTKETFLDGNNTFHGNQIISGSLSISGTTTLGGDIVPLSPRGATLGTLELPFSDIFVSSGSINIQSDVIGDPNTTISNIDGNLLLSAGGMRLLGNASFIASTGSFQYISGSMEQVGNYTQTGNYVMNGNKTITGSLSIKSGSAFPQSTGSSLVTYNQTTGQLAHANFTSVIPSLFNVGAFYDTTTQSGSANTSGSFRLNGNYNVNDGITITNNSRINIGRAGTYNIQVSLQIVQGSGGSTVYTWLKKNGSNVPNTGFSTHLSSNTTHLIAYNTWDVASSNTDYYEIAYQSNSNNTTYVANAATGNIPAIPSVIVTVNQVK